MREGRPALRRRILGSIPPHENLLLGGPRRTRTRPDPLPGSPPPSPVHSPTREPIRLPWRRHRAMPQAAPAATVKSTRTEVASISRSSYPPFQAETATQDTEPTDTIQRISRSVIRTTDDCSGPIHRPGGAHLTETPEVPTLGSGTLGRVHSKEKLMRSDSAKGISAVVVSIVMVGTSSREMPFSPA